MDERTMWEDLGKINPSIESEVIEAGNISDVEIRCPRPNVSDNYNKLTNKPKINGRELSGNKTLNELGIQPSGNYITESYLEEYDETIHQELNTKVDKEEGKGLSTNDYTNEDKEKLDNIDLSSKQDKLTSNNAGDNVTITEVDGIVKINSTGGGTGTSDYNDLTNKPKINDVTLSGNVSLDTLGITDLIDTKINTAIGNALKGSY